MDPYPDEDFPWTFYFNGVAMPKWGACWGMADIGLSKDAHNPSWDMEVGPRDIWIIGGTIDHVGKVESADPKVFRYVVQEVLCTLLGNREVVLEKLGRAWGFPVDPEEVYGGLVEAAFQMRELAIRDNRAFWNNGYEADRLDLIEAIRRSSLPVDHPEHLPPPHVRTQQLWLEIHWKRQLKELHRIASSGGLNKPLRRRLLDL